MDSYVLLLPIICVLFFFVWVCCTAQQGVVPRVYSFNPLVLFCFLFLFLPILFCRKVPCVLHSFCFSIQLQYGPHLDLSFGPELTFVLATRHGFRCRQLKRPRAATNHTGLRVRGLFAFRMLCISIQFKNQKIIIIEAT